MLLQRPLLPRPEFGVTEAGVGKVATASKGPNPRGSGEGWVESDQLHWPQERWREMGKGLGGVRHLGRKWGPAQEGGAGGWLESVLGSLLRVLLGYNTIFSISLPVQRTSGPPTTSHL